MPEVEALPDGVYLDLPEEAYFAQPREGSTDMTDYFLKKEGAWWSSHLNPDYKPAADEPGARTFGKALHALVLEGDQAYADRFARIPTKGELAAQHGAAKEGGKFCVTVGDMELALEQRGMNPKRMKKEELIPYARSRAPDLIIWDVFEEEWSKANRGKGQISGEEHRQLMIMTELVRSHPDVGPYFNYGPTHRGLTEVSILWTEPHGIRDMRRRGRLDAFFPQQTMDVKTLTNLSPRPLAFAIGDHLAKWALHVQMADHHVARNRAYRLIREGRIFDGRTDQQREEQGKAGLERFEEHKAWLAQYPDGAPNWEYVWLFYQKPDSKAGRAPIIMPWQEDYGSDLHMDGIRARRKAIALYLQCMAQFGPDVPWTRVEPVHTSREGAKNRVFLPAYIAEEHQAGEGEDL